MAKNVGEEVQPSSLLFYNADIEAQPGKTTESKRHRRQDKFQFGAGCRQEEGSTEHLDVAQQIPQNISLLQQKDPDIVHCIGSVKRERHLRYVIRSGQECSVTNGVLYKGDGVEARMVVP